MTWLVAREDFIELVAAKTTEPILLHTFPVGVCWVVGQCSLVGGTSISEKRFSFVFKVDGDDNFTETLINLQDDIPLQVRRPQLHIYCRESLKSQTLFVRGYFVFLQAKPGVTP